MIEFAVGLINQIGLLGAAIIIGIEVVIPPIPSEAVLLLTGFNVSLGRFGFFEAIFATTMGSLFGATALYALGYFFTQDRLENLVRKFGKFVGFSLKDFHKTIRWFEKYGSALVFFGRMVPIIRSLVSIPAGLIRMRLTKFYFFSAIGIVIWNTVWISIGLNLGENWKQGERFAEFLDWVMYAIVALLIVYVLVSFVRYLTSRNKQAD